MKHLTFDNKAIGGESKPRTASFDLSNSSDEVQEVILFDSSAFNRSEDEAKQVMKGVTFGKDSKISLGSGGSAVLKEIAAFVSKFPICVAGIKILTDSGKQRDAKLKITTPVLFQEPIVETIKCQYIDGGCEFSLPGGIFVGQGCAVSFELQPHTKATVVVNLGSYLSDRLIS